MYGNLPESKYHFLLCKSSFIFLIEFFSRIHWDSLPFFHCWTVQLQTFLIHEFAAWPIQFSRFSEVVITAKPISSHNDTFLSTNGFNEVTSFFSSLTFGLSFWTSIGVVVNAATGSASWPSSLWKKLIAAFYSGLVILKAVEREKLTAICETT